jgi:6-phosphofructokinase 2
MPAVTTLTLNPAVDFSSTASLVEPEHKIRCAQPRRHPGGGGINVARAIRKLGGEAVAVYASGGAIGALLESLLTDEGLSHQSVRTEGLTRENFTVLETDREREFRFLVPGPSLQADEWQGCLDAVEKLSPPPEYLVASGSLPPGVPDDFYGRVARLARKRGSRFVLDTSGEPLRAALEETVYLVKPNRRELQQLTGRELGNSEEQVEACRELIGRGNVEVVALTLGAEGALLAAAGGFHRAQPPKVQVRSSVGAGDSFLGALVLGLVRRMPLEEAFCFGVAAGTAALLTPGTELCRREDAEELYGRMCGAQPAA